MRINSKSDLNRAVANALHPEPPAVAIMTPNRLKHECGFWTLVPVWLGRTIIAGYWEPADFCGDPVASKLLRDRMRNLGWFIVSMDVREVLRDGTYARETKLELWRGGLDVTFQGRHSDDQIALALAALRALGVEFELQEGWDTK